MKKSIGLLLGLAAMAEVGRMDYESPSTEKRSTRKKASLTPAQQKKKAKARKKRKNKR